MSDDKKPDSKADAPDIEDAPEAVEKKLSETQEKISAAAKAAGETTAAAAKVAGEKTAAAAKVAGEKTAAAAKVAGEKTAAAAARAREEAGKSYEEARSSISDADDRTIAIVSYVLFLASSVTAGLGPIVGLILAYLKKDTGDELLDSHYEFQIRTFWIGLFGVLISFPLMLVLIGFPLLFAVGVWWLLRNVIGLIRLLDGKPIPDPKTWLV